MFNYREILTTEPTAKKCAQMIQEHSWGNNYPIDAWEELKESEYIIGCFDDDKIVGLGSISRIASPDKVDNGLLWFAHTVVLPDYRKQGIYETLYEKRLEYVKKRNEGFILTCTDNLIIEKFLLKNKWILYRTTKDESGNFCKIFKLNIKNKKE